MINATNNQATITFFPNVILQQTLLAAYEASQPGYGTAYLEVALHEIAHLQGIADYTSAAMVPPPGVGTSVVTPFYGVNDTGNVYQKSGPTTCDVQQASSSSRIIDPPRIIISSGGGGSKGGLGSPVPQDEPPSGGASTCDEYFDSSTNTLYENCT